MYIHACTQIIKSNHLQLYTHFTILKTSIVTEGNHIVSSGSSPSFLWPWLERQNLRTEDGRNTLTSPWHQSLHQPVFWLPGTNRQRTSDICPIVHPPVLHLASMASTVLRVHFCSWPNLVSCFCRGRVSGSFSNRVLYLPLPLPTDSLHLYQPSASASRKASLNSVVTSVTLL